MVVGNIHRFIKNLYHFLLLFLCSQNGLKSVGWFRIFADIFVSFIEDGDDVRIVDDSLVVFDEFDGASADNIFD